MAPPPSPDGSLRSGRRSTRTSTSIARRRLSTSLASGRSAEEDGLLDCYPYTFSPLLLFAEASYFDKGYSNYNSVAAFFAGVLEVNMLENVLYERKNMLYEDLLHHVASQRRLTTGS